MVPYRRIPDGVTYGPRDALLCQAISHLRSMVDSPPSLFYSLTDKTRIRPRDALLYSPAGRRHKVDRGRVSVLPSIWFYEVPWPGCLFSSSCPCCAKCSVEIKCPTAGSDLVGLLPHRSRRPRGAGSDRALTGCAVLTHLPTVSAKRKILRAAVNEIIHFPSLVMILLCEHLDTTPRI